MRHVQQVVRDVDRAAAAPHDQYVSAREGLRNAIVGTVYYLSGKRVQSIHRGDHRPAKDAAVYEHPVV
jgi:hypothetical protein